MGQGLGRLVGHWDRLGPRRAPSAQVRLQQFAGGAQVLEPRLAVSEQRQHRMVLFGVVRTWVARQRVVCVPERDDMAYAKVLDRKSWMESAGLTGNRIHARYTASRR